MYLHDVSAEPMTSAERVAVERSLERSLQQAEAGELIDAEEVLAELHRA